ncbi:MAG: hypothetical protein ACOCSJ_00735 [Candidatus Natronoplasma sp.]
MGNKILIRDVKGEEVLEARLEFECEIVLLKKKLVEYLGYEMSEYYTLNYKGMKMSEERTLDFYGIEEHDLLILEENPQKGKKYPLDKDLETVEIAKKWLEENIGVARSMTDLLKYRRTDDKKSEMFFEFKDKTVKLLSSKDKIEDYGFISSKKRRG